jgi:signal recognition particle GTPase
VERKYAQYESMIQSMNKKEREAPELLAKSPSRRWVRSVSQEGVALKEA